jgi:hypothetical protein
MTTDEARQQAAKLVRRHLYVDPPPALVDDIAAALVAARPQWQPIETARVPKESDDWFIDDVWCEHSIEGLGGRYPNSSLRQNGRWYDSGGNLLNWESKDEDGAINFRRATHWMPLPAPPVEALLPAHHGE